QTLRYRAQPPDRVAERLIAIRRRELDRVADTATVIAGELLPQYRSGLAHAEHTDYVEVLRDAEHAVQRVEQLWAEARREVVSLVRPPYLALPVPQRSEEHTSELHPPEKHVGGLLPGKKTDLR